MTSLKKLEQSQNKEINAVENIIMKPEIKQKQYSLIFTPERRVIYFRCLFYVLTAHILHLRLEFLYKSNTFLYV